ncbi:MAG: signal peptidase I [Elusimicrobiota bacterium]
MTLKRFLFLFAIAAAVAGVLRHFVFEGIYIASASMEPTLGVGSHLFLDKTTYLFRAPRRGEVVVFGAPVPPHKEMVKRIVAVSGDSVELRHKKLVLNGAEIEEDYVQYTRPGERLQGDSFGPVTVPAGAVFVLGDNRDESNDSASWRDPGSGEPVYFVPRARIRGRLRGVY